MKFRVVWVDDSKDWVELKETEIRGHFKAPFDLDLLCFEDVDSARETFEHKYIDLVLVDCNLGDISGDSFILELRRNRIFSQIIFYSEDRKNLNKLKAANFFLRKVHRDNLADAVEEVVSNADELYRNPAFMRGVLLSEFIDLENFMEELISEAFESKADLFREMIINKHDAGFTFNAKLKFVMRLIDMAEKNTALKDELDGLKFSDNSFRKKILDKRNILAHAHPHYNEKTGSITLISPIKNVNFSSNWFHTTREDIYEFKQKIKGLLQLDIFGA